MFKVTAQRPGSTVEQHFDNLHEAADKFTELVQLGFQCTFKRVYKNTGVTAWITQ
jgi:hypothetical protein